MARPSFVRRLLRAAAIPDEELEALDVLRPTLTDAEAKSDGDTPIFHGPYSADTGTQLALLDELRDDAYQDLFDALRADPRINPGYGGVDYRPRGLIHNGYLPTPDAELYGAMITRHRPSAIIEVGAGFSTAVARTSINRSGASSTLHVIDPEPRVSVADLADRVEIGRVEDSSLRSEGVPEGSLLFIDSSHITRAGGDGPFLYCELLPTLPADVLVHVHDIFLPHDYPRVYRRRLYTEQYLLHALLSNSEKFEVLFATNWMVRAHPEQMQAVFGPEVTHEGPFGGASFWMRST